MNLTTAIATIATGIQIILKIVIVTYCHIQTCKTRPVYAQAILKIKIHKLEQIL